MSGIIGFYNSSFSSSKILDYSNKMSYRGETFFCENLKSENFVFGFLGSINIFLNQDLKKSVLIAENQITNWEKLNEKYDLNCDNCDDFLYVFLEKFNLEKVDELNGAYVFAYYRDNKIILMRDVVGIKSVCYFHEGEKFGFASEGKALPFESLEMNPREYVVFDCDSFDLQTLPRKRYYGSKLQRIESFEDTKKKVKELFIRAIEKKVKKGDKIGILFSGGTDSTFMSLILQELGIDFTCYTASITSGNIEEGHDVMYARKIAKERGLNWKIAQLEIDEIVDMSKEIMKTIESTN